VNLRRTRAHESSAPQHQRRVFAIAGPCERQAFELQQFAFVRIAEQRVIDDCHGTIPLAAELGARGVQQQFLHRHFRAELPGRLALALGCQLNRTHGPTRHERNT
jgi:hypothetical protein